MTPEQRRERKRTYYLKHRDEILSRVASYRLKNKDRIAASCKARRLKNPEKWKRYCRAQYLKHREKRLVTCRAYHHKNRDRLVPKMRARYRENAEALKDKQRKYYRKNKTRVRAYVKEYTLRNPDKIRQRSRVYRERNQDRIRAYDRMRSGNPSPARRKAWKRWQSLNRERINGYQKAVRFKALTLLGRACAQCGWDEDMELIEIDHKIALFQRGLKRPVSGTTSVSEALRNPEGFQLLCPNCHAIKTSLEKRSKNPGETVEKKKYRRARNWLIKMFGSECRMCRFDEDPLAFEFDHINPILGINRSSAVHHVRKNPSIFQMLCANCHAMKTKLDRLDLKRRKQNASAQ